MKTKPEDRRGRTPGVRPAAWGLLVATAGSLFALCGCSGQTAAGGKPPSPDQARAFKGGEMTAGERAGMAKEQADAAAYRKAHPEQFPTENTAAPAPPPAAR